VLHELVTSTQAVLGDNFIGAYLQGSFAAGDWDAHSDVDRLIAIVIAERASQVIGIGVGLRRRGLARTLLCRSIAALRAHQVARLCIGTRYENPTAAWRLYAQVGFRKAAAFPAGASP
jgi:hypothetical protein